MTKKSRDRSNAARQASQAAGQKSRDRKDDQAGNAVGETPPRPNFHPPRKNVPMLILSIVLLIVWLIIMLAIAISE